MNSVTNLLRRESGYGFVPQYDAALLRLLVRERDSWKGITPSTFTADFNPSPPILAAKFAKCTGYEHVLAIANEDGKLAIQNTNEGNEEPGGERALDGVQCHYNAVFDIEWMPGEMKIVTASGDHTAQLWSVTESDLVSTQAFRGHSRSVKTAAFRRDDPAIFATGGRDGAILIWDIRAQLGSNLLPRADNCIYSGHAGGPGTPASHRKRTRQTPKIPAQGCSSSITGLVFQDSNTLISCGAGDGVIKVWDTRRHYTSHQRDPLPKHSFPYAGTTTLKGFTNLVIDEVRHRLYVNCMDNHIYCYNVSTYEAQPLQRYGGFKNGTFYVKAALSPDGQYLISGSSDERSYVWNVDHPNPLLQLRGHAAEVTSVAWMQSQRKVRLVTCSDDARHKIWRLGPEELDSDERQQLRGTTEYCSSYRQRPHSPRAPRTKALEFTPRSLKRNVQRNETTPSTLEGISRTPTNAGSGLASSSTAGASTGIATGGSNKRSYTMMAQSEDLCAPGTEDTAATSSVSLCPPVKRPYRSEECRGRRLFSPANCKSSFSFTALEIASSSSSSRSLNVILEASEEQQTTISSRSPCKSPLATADLNIRSLDRDSGAITLNSSSTIGSSSANANLRSLLCSSHTTSLLNLTLPNFVIDGEAPHLVNVIASGGGSGAPGSMKNAAAGGSGAGTGGTGALSGGMMMKHKLKENIDWLTKIRKQKLLQAAKTIITDGGGEVGRPLVEGVEDTVSLLLSPRLQQLKACDERKSSTSTTLQPSSSSTCTAVEDAEAASQPTTPTSRKRRSSRTSFDCISQMQTDGGVGDGLGPRTPKSRRNSVGVSTVGMQPTTPETTVSIRRYFTVTTTPTSRMNAQTSH
ncbi:protein lethal(2)denticleless-like [Anopheles albimanus]|uniref:protein lethal(2)denticleless-like n=1 Tax=Anopheles albimanus TaxID=7167 RepID=UPI001640EAA6|nr:protein lethal(2)denticleless-like [Anopheles albimanus]